MITNLGFFLASIVNKRWKGTWNAALLVIVLASSAWAYTIYSVYKLNSGSATQTDQTYTTSAADTCGVWVTKGASLTLTNPTVITSGDTSSGDDSSFYGLNAAILASAGGTIQLTGGAVTTTGKGANGVFATGSGSTVTMSDVTINCTGQLGHGVDATDAGTLIIKNVTATTTGSNGSVIATDRGSGTIDVVGGTYIAGGRDSAGIYSTGKITVANAKVGATGGEAVVVEGGNSTTLTDVELFGAKGAKDRGIMIYNSQSGDAESGKSYFSMTGGSYTWPSTSGPAFFVTNQTTTITLTGAVINSSAEKLVYAAAADWGKSGLNGGTAIFVANQEALTGDLIADSISSIEASLNQGTTLIGAANRVKMAIDETSAWIIDGDSAVTGLSNAGEIQFNSNALKLTDNGDFTLASTSLVSIQLGSDSAYNQIAVTGKATIAGVLSVNLADGYIPRVGQTFSIMTCSSKSGAFTSVISGDNSGVQYSIDYNTTGAVITVASVPTTVSSWVIME